MLSPQRATALLIGGLVTASLCLAQLAISTHSGLIQFTLGSVFLEDQPLHKTTTNMVEVKPGQVLRTGHDGAAEVLLTPGVFLRLGNDSSIRMDSNALSDTRVSLLSGAAMVECAELLEGNAVSFTVGNQPVRFKKKGLYRLEADPAAVAVVKGEALVDGSLNTVVKKGKLLQLNAAAPEPVKFHLNKKDDLYAFSKARAEDSVYATGVTSSSLYSAGYTGCKTSSWYPMSGVGMYSYLPCGGVYSSPFGYSFLGLNAGYLWEGPSYYMAPYALYGYGPGYIGRGYSSAIPSGPGKGGVGKGAPVNGPVPGGGNPQRPVPIYAGPGYHGGHAGMQPGMMNGSMRHGMGGMHNMQGMAGPAVGRAGAMGASHAGSFGSHGGFGPGGGHPGMGGGAPNGSAAGRVGGYPGGAAHSAGGMSGGGPRGGGGGTRGK